MGLENKEKLVINRGEIERQGRITTIRKPEGIYSIEYQNHTSLEELPPKFLQNIDGYCLEGAWEYPKSEEDFLKIFTANQRWYKFYGEFFEKPVLLTECNIPIVPAVIEGGILGIEFGSGLALASKIGKEIESDRKGKIGYSRRRFFRDVGIGLTSLYLTSPLLSSFGRMVLGTTDTGAKPSADLLKTTLKIHPEIGKLTLFLRDAVSSQKMKYLMEQKGFSHLLSPRGAAHVTLEEMILADEKVRLDFLRKMVPIYKKISDPETFYKIRQYDFVQGKWAITAEYEEPRLREIMKVRG